MDISSRCILNRRYPIKVTRYTGKLRDAFASFLHDNPAIKAIFVGVRRTDPYCENLQMVQVTDNGWPSFTRIHPILDWSYSKVWSYLRSNDIPYCGLYDCGYTSLGDEDRTFRNPLLKMPHADDEYYPAYCLTDDLQERAGRL